MYTIFYKRFIDYDVIFEICLMGSACIQINCCRRAFKLVAADGVLRFREPIWNARARTDRTEPNADSFRTLQIMPPDESESNDEV